MGELVAAVPHRPPVGDRDPDVVERGDEVLAEQLQACGVAAVDLHVDPGLVGGPLLDPDVRAVVADHPEHRVDDEVDAEPHRRHRHADGVDEEGHVVGDDLDDRVRRLPAVRDQVRVEDLDVGVPSVRTSPSRRWASAAPSRSRGSWAFRSSDDRCLK
jgi:hypothetical protein